MRHSLSVLCFLAIALPGVDPASAELKKVPYPQVKVEMAAAFKPDGAFNTMLKTFRDAINQKDPVALSGLIGPTFVWAAGDANAEEFDMGRDSLHNFKVAFGFRQPGEDADGEVDDGPYWNALSVFARNDGFYRENDKLVCGPMAAGVLDDKLFEQAKSRIETAQDKAKWYFTVADTPVSKAPGDAGPSLGTIGKATAVPQLSAYAPPSRENNSLPTFLEVLLPTGASGWVPVSAVRELTGDHLCYARTPRGEWKIVAYYEEE